jgi:transcriptional regulator with XRE-family HTH domain
MDLKEYLYRKKISIVEFSKLMDLSRTHISLIVNKKRIPGKKLAKKISTFTEGFVSVEELKGIELNF